MNKKHWWKVMAFVVTVSVAGVTFIGIRTYQDAPPIADFVDAAGQVVVSRGAVLRGQELFQRYALMEHGTMFGDGGGRGPDYTADALHQVALTMVEYYDESTQAAQQNPEYGRDAVQARVQREIKENRYDTATRTVTLTDGQVHAAKRLTAHYEAFFAGADVESFQPAGYITDKTEIADLAAFFFWGAWVCGAERPGKDYSYTHNWPVDAVAGNFPTSLVMLWSVLGSLGLIAGVGVVLYVYGRLGNLVTKQSDLDTARIATIARVRAFAPTDTQRAAYKFFAVSAVLFLVQVLAGVLTVHDFVGFTKFFGVDIATWLPITVVRSWHVQLSVLWISACWIGGTVFIIPMICRPEPKHQLLLVNVLFGVLVAIVAGTAVGVVLGPMGILGDWWRFIGHQGWEFVEMGKLWQIALYGAFVLWGVIVVRGLYPALRAADPWAMPNWLVYSIVSILLLFGSGFVANAQTNFVIADFWRWCVIHMWVEAFFEVFTTVLVGYFLYVMGLIGAAAAVRVTYLATLLFLGSGILGISHNFYWNAKSIETVAIGSVFSTLQVVPLILLTVEAWRFRQLPQTALRNRQDDTETRAGFGLAEPFMFLVGVNFWNFVGAGVFGFIINLPIVNYYEHGTYLTVNHGHAALMGVYGNLAIASMLFCARHLVRDSAWTPAILRISFWSLNIGLALMLALDLFPAGILQLEAAMNQGLWYARSQAFIQGAPFQTLTWMRIVGGAIFVVGGVVPLAYFMVSRAARLRDAIRLDASSPLVASGPRLTLDHAEPAVLDSGRAS